MLQVNISSIVRRVSNQEHLVLRDLNFSIESGKTYTILGKNGSGKSTLIKSLTNLLDPRTYLVYGNANWNGKNLILLNNDDLQFIRKKEVRYVLQELNGNFDPLKKIKYYLESTGIEKSECNRTLLEFLLPDYESLAQLYSHEISGGMAQRLSLMLAMIVKPKLLILDEPTSAIDYTNINLVKIKLEEHKRLNNASLIVTQDINFARVISDEIAFLDNGMLSSFNPATDFFAGLNSTNSDLSYYNNVPK